MELTDRQVNDMQQLMDSAGDVPRRRKRKVGKGPVYWLWDSLPISYKFDTWFPEKGKAVVREVRGTLCEFETETENYMGIEHIQFT